LERTSLPTWPVQVPSNGVSVNGAKSSSGSSPAIPKCTPSVDMVFVQRSVSGSKPLRDAALLEILRSGDVVITPKLDRMFCSALDALDVLGRLKDRAMNLHMIDLGGDVAGDDESKLAFTILSAVAAAERDRTRERIAEVKRDQRQRGRCLGGKTPFGLRVGETGELIAIPEQQGAVRRMLRLNNQGLALRTIADRMKASGMSSPTSASRGRSRHPVVLRADGRGRAFVSCEEVVNARHGRAPSRGRGG